MASTPTPTHSPTISVVFQYFKLIIIYQKIAARHTLGERERERQRKPEVNVG